MTAPHRVLIADKMSSRAAEILAASPAIEVDVRAGLTAGDLEAVIADYDALLVRSRTQVTAAVIEAGTRLKLVGRAGIGVDNIDIPAASRRGIIVENAPSGNSVTTAEHALCLLMSLARNIPQATASLKAGKWEKSKLSGHELFEKTLGVVGLGNIGRIVADRARGLGMKIVGYDPYIGREAAARLGIELATLDDLFARADFITVHTPLTDETRGLLGADAFAKVKPGVLVVNAARGGIVDEDALLAALESGKVGGAALDVFSSEPPPEGHPLIAHPAVICTPHLGASTGEAQDKVAAEIAEQVVAFFTRNEIINALNIAPVAADLGPQLAPWLDLSKRLGSLIAQLARGGFDSDRNFIDELSVEIIGEPGQLGATACTNAALVGLLQIFLEGPVNEVNAPLIAEDRSLSVTEVKRKKDRDLASAIAVTARFGDTVHVVKGSLYHVADRVEPRVLQVDDFVVEATPRGHILAVLNEDRPGVIGRVGTLLGEREINVSSLHVGQDRKGRGTALALWCLGDEAIPADLVDAVRAAAMVSRAHVISL